MFMEHNSKQFGKQFYINPSNLALSAFAQERNPAMSDAYYERWNDSLQSGIDERIEYIVVGINTANHQKVVGKNAGAFT